MKLNCLIIDDEPLARKGIGEYVGEVPFLRLIGECDSAAAATKYLNNKDVDLLLLDIQLPRLSGIDFLRTLSHPPMAILTTAYTEYALEGYSLDVIDYLVKPIPFDRFLKAANKALDFHALKTKTSTESSDFIFVKSNGKYERVFFRDILFIESMQNYVIIHMADQKLIVYMTLSGIEAQLPPGFLKVHKSFIVATARVNSIDSTELTVGKSKIPISRALRDEVVKKIMGDRSLKR